MPRQRVFIKRNQFRIYAQTGSFQYQVGFVATNGTTYETLATTLALGAGAGYLRMISRYTAVGVHASLWLTNNQVGFEEGSANPGSTFLIQNSMGIALGVGPSLLWQQSPSSVGINLSLPIVFNQVFWPEINIGSFSSIGVSWGLSFAVEIPRGNWMFTPRFGFLGSPSKFFWNMETGIRI